MERCVHGSRNAKECLFSLLLHSAVQLQGQRVTDFNILRNFKLFSKVTVPFCTLTNNV